MRLTESVIQSLKPKPQRYSRSDNGLAIEVLPSGTKSFCTWRQGRKTVLGRWPDMSLKDARTELARLIAEEADRPVTVKQSMTFRRFVEGPYKSKAAAQRRRGDLTIERLTHVFLTRFPLIADKLLHRITPEHIDELVVSLQGHYAPSTAARELSDLKHVFNCAVRWGFIRRSPAEHAKGPSLDRGATKLYMSKAEVARLAAALNDWRRLSTTYEVPRGRGYHGNPYPVWFVVLVRLLMNTGLRKAEALGLRWGAVNFDESYIEVRGATSKTGQTRRAPISATLRQDLYAWFVDSHGEDAEEPDPDTPLWPVRGIRKPWERLRRMAKLGPEFTPHLLRHHFASTLVNEHGVPLPTVKRLLGHSDIQTTMRYLSTRVEDMQRAVELL